MIEENFVAPHNADGDRLKEARLVKLNNLKEAGINPYPYKYDVNAKAAELQEKYKDLPADTTTEDVVKVAGRIKAYRNSGMFIDLHDESGKIQIFSYKKALPELEVLKMKNVELGDIIGVEGVVRRSHQGELDIKTTEITVLSKSLATLPEKFHGLTDVEQRYRQRHVDFIMNDKARQNFINRSKVIKKIKSILDEKDFLEVETPVLQPIYGGGAAEPFVTHHNSLDMDMFLRVSNELYLKRYIIGGFERVYEFVKDFRNEGIDTTHNPEFTQVEIYQQFADYNDMMSLVEEIFETLVVMLHGDTKVQIGENVVDFKAPFKKGSMIDLIKEYLGKDISLDSTVEDVYKIADELNVDLKEGLSWGTVIEEIFELVEPKLIQPIHVTDYPKDVSPLTKEHRDNPRLVERFETRINGTEVCNSYSELSDPQDQYERFLEQVKQRESGDAEAQMMDEDFIKALEHGMAPTGGLGIGIDRLLMMLLGEESIREVIAFPTLKAK
jgi:lysyl-tRNA synthetase, class II